MAKRKIQDWSNFSGVVDSAKIEAAKADGFEGCILGTQYPDITRAQYAACLAENFPVEALYVFVYWTTADYALLDAAKKLGEEFNLSIWLDCEWTKTGYPGTGTWAPPARELIDRITAYKAWLGVRYAGIYTGRWWWPVYTNDCQDFAGDKLWHADYGGPADFDNFIHYGGWVRPTIIQYSSDGADGIVADLDEEEVPDMPEPIIKNGLIKEDDGLLYLYNDGVPIRRWGGIIDPSKKGREAWLFGTTWMWLRHYTDPVGTWEQYGFLSQNEGD